MDTTSDVNRFHWADYLVFALALALSSSIGIYYGVLDRRRKATDEDFLMAGRSMPFLPVSISLFVSWLSAISFLADPVEVYYQGSVYFYIVIGYCLAPPLVAFVFAPLYHRMKLISAFSFLEDRFNKYLRAFACMTSLAGTLYLAVVLYGPALALNQVSGLSVEFSIVLIGAVCTFYTTLGGMKAVLWADTAQTGVMLAGYLAILIRGCIVMGGLGNVWNIAKEEGRINFDSFDPNPLVRSSFWTYVIGGYFRVLNPLVAGQTWIQRYGTLRTERDVKMAVLLNIPMYAIFVTMAGLIGLIMVAYFRGCDPLLDGRISKPDQMLPLMMLDMLGMFPGFPGLFFACLFSASLSTMSSIQSGLAAIFLKDLVEPVHKRITGNNMSRRQGLISAMILTIIFGLVTIGMAMVVLHSDNKSIFNLTMKITGVLFGPIAGMFIIGVFFPFVNTVSAFIGFVLGFAIPLWWTFGAMFNRLKFHSLPVTSEGCLLGNNTWTENTTEVVIATTFYPRMDNSTLAIDSTSGALAVYWFSPILYPALGTTITTLVGVIVGGITVLVCGSRRSSKYNAKDASDGCEMESFPTK